MGERTSRTAARSGWLHGGGDFLRTEELSDPRPFGEEVGHGFGEEAAAVAVGAPDAEEERVADVR